MNNNEILSKLKQDLETSQSIKTIHDDYVSKMRNLYEGNLTKPEYGSSFVSREIFKQVEWAITQLKNPFISNDTIVRLTANDASVELFTLQSERLLNYMFTKQFDRYNFMTDALKVLLIEGTVIVRTSWEYIGKETEVNEPVIELDSNGNPIISGSVKVNKEIPIINKPTATVVKTGNVFIDPTAYDTKDIQYVIHKREVRLSDLKESGIYKNLDKIETEFNTDTNSIDPYNSSRNPNLSVNLEDKERKKIYMYEYWGNYDLDGDGIVEPIVCCWIHDTIIRLEENPYPDKKIPYIIANYIKEPFSLYGTALVEMLEDQQTLKTGILRGILDDIAESNSKQIGIQKGNLDAVNLRRFYEGKPFEFNLSPNAFYKGQYNRIPGEVFSMLQYLDQDIQTTSGIIPFQGGQGSQGIYGSQAGKLGQMNSMALRELDQVYNVSENIIKPLLRKWLQYCYELLEPEEIQLITHMQYIPVPKNIDNEYYSTFTIDVSTQYTDEVKASELAFLLQTLGNNMPMEMTQILMAKIADLKQMPDLANEVRNFKQQPDPLQQQMQQLQLQQMQLQLQEMQSESQYKQAKAKETQAKAQNINMENLAKQYGVDQKKQLELINAQKQAKLEELQAKAKLDLQNQIPSDMGINGATNNQKSINSQDLVSII